MHEVQLLGDIPAVAFLGLLPSIFLAFLIGDERLRRAGNAVCRWFSTRRGLAVSVLAAFLVVVSRYSAVL
jgi:hypothetical protein